MPRDLALQAAAILERRLRGRRPRVGVILGSGLAGFTETIASPITVSYRALPGFPRADVEGHAGDLVAGTVAGVGVIALSGRVHAYEALPFDAHRVPVRTLRRLGIEILVLTNAAGSVRRSIGPGRLMLISDHINLLGMNPLSGPNDAAYGPRFPDMKDAYDPDLRRRLRQAARRVGVGLAEGIYLALPGPSFETAAEIRAFKRLGADAVGMSTVPEAIVARHCGIRVVGISVITNLAQGLAATAPSHEGTLAVAGRASRRLVQLLEEFLRMLPAAG
ncbi:MAG TPA: purine-nucleoside phosphorylase [Stellaceae bacterium]|nr:purine-nucleoside phosphorylase [Stellaceae bacterium]